MPEILPKRHECEFNRGRDDYKQFPPRAPESLAISSPTFCQHIAAVSGTRQRKIRMSGRQFGFAMQQLSRRAAQHAANNSKT